RIFGICRPQPQHGTLRRGDVLIKAGGFQSPIADLGGEAISQVLCIRHIHERKSALTLSHDSESGKGRITLFAVFCG
ncbi:MAG: hypothetical protein ACKVH1_08235, partial [Alphaproteobacteria bacterium]